MRAITGGPCCASDALPLGAQRRRTADAPLNGFAPFRSVISMIPSLGGLGVREGAYVLFFSGFGGSEKAFALGLLYFATTIGASIIGGICYLFTGRVAPEELEKMEEEDMKILEERDVVSGSRSL